MIDSQWRKSSASSSNANCVEVRKSRAGTVQVRDSKDRNGPHLTFVPEVWNAFVDDIKNGSLRLPG
jgi:hypothetical protein